MCRHGSGRLLVRAKLRLSSSVWQRRQNLAAYRWSGGRAALLQPDERGVSALPFARKDTSRGSETLCPERNFPLTSPHPRLHQIV